MDATISELLAKTSAFQATDPRDKVYALESLLPRFAGKLICIDYSEDYETVFKRATARCYNVYQALPLSRYFPFLFEAPICSDNLSSCPSWVLNFRFSDAVTRRQQGMDPENVTLENLIFEKGITYADHMPRHIVGPIFATPSTLFCTGSSIDSLCKTGVIRTDEREKQWLKFLFFASDVRDQRRLILARAPKYGHVDPMQDYFAKTELDDDTAEDSRDKSADEQIKLMGFFALMSDYKSPVGESTERLNTRFKNVNGKDYFITKKGLVGIATAPVQEGDILALLHKAPLYFILREVDAQTGDAKGEQKHRIVARAVVYDYNYDVGKWFKSLPRRDFRIV
ncbi:hypothetical protein F4679DRAFT_569064 [Xylaria curta]|nr:hypothetical protein F4679DRAFT_569064 [Xylaria curta]